MPATYINTPQTNDASYLSNGLDRLGDLSPEKSFYAPPQNGDLITQMRNARNAGMNLKTPRVGSRGPLRLLPNGNQGKTEFTPLMKSATKNNMARRLSARKADAVDKPGYLKDGYVHGTTPGLPRLDELSHLQSENTSSSAGNNVDFTPMPQHASSSAQSTPLAQLPARDAGAVVNEGNMMTLREQENIIDKIEKENFGLKMKIHFLEEAMSKRGGEFNQAALKENTDLKVNRITMQRELHKFKKNIAEAERDAEVYRLQLEEYRQRIRRKQADETVRIELETLRNELQSKTTEIDQLRSKQESAHSVDRQQLDKLRDELGDLEAEIREKDRQIEDREDQIDNLKMNASKESSVSAELEEELESAKQQVEELKNDLQRSARELQEAKSDRDEAIGDKRKAEDDLDELQDEIANKSFSTKGLSRQLEEKANKLEDDFEELQERHTTLKAELEEKARSEKKLQEQLRELQKGDAAGVRDLQQQFDLARQQCDTLERKMSNMNKQIETLQKDFQIKTDEKDLLQTRHDALTTESAELQKDLAKSRRTIQELENAIDEERHRAAHNDNMLRTQHKTDIDLLTEQIDNLHRDIDSSENERAADVEQWEDKSRNLEAACQKAQEKANGLQRTVDKLQDAQGTLSGREMRLQEALESEKQRHSQEEKVLLKQIEDLNADLSTRRDASDNGRTELNNAKEELRISIREQAALKQKLAELEEEIEVLQADIEQEHEFAEQLQKKSVESADAQVLKLRKEKQSLQEDLATAQVDLQSLRRTLKAAEADRDALESKVQRSQLPNDDTFNMDQEKRDLRRTKQKLEQELTRLKSEHDSLTEANNALEEEINAEVERAAAEEDRLNAELTDLRHKHLTGADVRDRDLLAARNKVVRLEAKIKDLEALMENQYKIVNSPGIDVSGLRYDLSEARKNETAATRRETELKTAHRDLKMKVNDLEKELHEARLAQLKAISPSRSPPSSNSKELTQLRQNLIDAQSELCKAKEEARELRRTKQKPSNEFVDKDGFDARPKTTDTGRLHEQVTDQDAIIIDLQKQLKRIREERDEARNASINLGNRERQINDLRTQLKGGRPENDNHEPSMQVSVRNGEARKMKDQLNRLREERSLANHKAEEVEKQLEVIQSRYENMLEQLTSGKDTKAEIRQKEVKGLIKEIMWLKAKCRREERLRKDLAWSKAYLEQGEAMRVQCNQIDLRILRDMGVDVDKKKYEQKLRPIQKLRAGVLVVIAAIRMSDMEEQWRNAKKISEGFNLATTRHVA